MENKGRNVWIPIAIVAIIIGLLLLCLLVAVGCAGFAFMMRSSSSAAVPAVVPPAVMTVVPELIGTGATITYVEPGSPADNAGLQRGDVITAVDSTTIDANHELATVIGAYGPGNTVTITYRQWRTGQTATASVTLGQNPSDNARPYLGIEYSDTPGFGGD